MAEVGRVEVARDLQVRALRAANKRLAQELDILKKALLETSYHVAYYNAKRRHSALDYQSPNYFETHPQTTSQLCPA